MHIFGFYLILFFFFFFWFSRSREVSARNKEKPNKDQLEGSTLAPSFPRVIIKKPKTMNGPFYFDDVRLIRFAFKLKIESILLKLAFVMIFLL
jgi:hypothetical protein